MKYIYKQNGKYVFEKRTNGKRTTITCPDLETAKDIKTIYQENNWIPNLSKPSLYDTEEYYYILYRPEKTTKILLKTKDINEAQKFLGEYVDMDHISVNENKIVIQKSIKNKNQIFGNYNTIEEAIKFRNLLREHDWDYDYFKEIYKHSEQQERRYIYKSRGKYVIRKQNRNGLQRTYGEYNTFEEAKKERDILEQNGWNINSNRYITKLFKRYWVYYPRRKKGKVSRDFYDSSYDLDEIKQIRNRYVSEGFPETPKFSTDRLRYISKTNDYYYIEKKNKKYWGNKDLLEVIDVRDLLEKFNWELISGNHKINGAEYDVEIDTDGKIRNIDMINETDYRQYINLEKGFYIVSYDHSTFGSYNNIDDAVKVCRVMCRFDWNYDLFKNKFF